MTTTTEAAELCGYSEETIATMTHAAVELFLDRVEHHITRLFIHGRNVEDHPGTRNRLHTQRDRARRRLMALDHVERARELAR
jgi:hypothetical protein